MVTGLNWTTYQAQIATLAVTQTTDPNFVAILPTMVDFAELMICQDLDLLYNQQANTTFGCMANSRVVAIPSGTFVTIEDVNIITPAGTSDPNLGTRNPCKQISREVLDNFWPSSTGAGVPNKVALLGQFNLLFGPWPSANFTLEVIGTTRPPSLSSTNPATFISLNLPHLLVAASMIYISGYQRNFGRQSDDPAMAMSWKSYYDVMKGASDVEEARRKWEGPAWTAKSPSKYAAPTRGPANKAA